MHRGIYGNKLDDRMVKAAINFLPEADTALENTIKSNLKLSWTKRIKSSIRYFQNLRVGHYGSDRGSASLLARRTLLLLYPANADAGEAGSRRRLPSLLMFAFQQYDSVNAQKT